MVTRLPQPTCPTRPDPIIPIHSPRPTCPVSMAPTRVAPTHMHTVHMHTNPPYPRHMAPTHEHWTQCSRFSVPATQMPPPPWLRPPRPRLRTRMPSPRRPACPLQNPLSTLPPSVCLPRRAFAIDSIPARYEFDREAAFGGSSTSRIPENGQRTGIVCILPSSIVYIYGICVIMFVHCLPLFHMFTASL